MLLHAASCQHLGLLTYPTHPSTVELQLLPQLPLPTSPQWLQSHEVVGPTDLSQAVTADGVSDLLDARADVAITEANVEKVLRACNDERFPEVAYSLDDIVGQAWGASQEEIEASGLVGIVPGGAFTSVQVRRLKQLCLKHRAAFSTGKIPHANSREPVRVDLIPDPPDARYHYRP